MTVAQASYTLFAGTTLVAHGSMEETVLEAKRVMDAGAEERIALYQDSSGKVIDIDPRGTVDDVLERLKSHPVIGENQAEATTPRGPGRPKLGVVSREVTLLPRHWEWLAAQRGGASVTLRRLVDEARRHDGGREKVRAMQAALDHFLWDMASNFNGFEEATRALYSGNEAAFKQHTSDWPEDVRHYAAERFAGICEMRSITD